MLKWLTVIGLAAAPALILGQTAAWGFGFRWELSVPGLFIAISMASFVEGVALAWLATLLRHADWFSRMAARVHDSRVGGWIVRRGPWVGLLLGTSVLGQEPFIIALVWLGVPPKKLVLPLLVENLAYTVLYGVMVHHGLADWDALMKMLKM